MISLIMISFKISLIYGMPKQESELILVNVCN